MRCFLLFVLSWIFVLAGSELYIDPAGGSVSSEAFVSVQGNIPGGVPPEVKIALKENNLHIEIISRRAPGWQINIAGEKNDDETMFRGETAEVFLKPETSKNYYHFALNPENRHYSARDRDNSWEPPCQVTYQVTRGKDFWSAGFIIPLAAVNMPVPQEKSVLRANFAASYYENGKRVSASWSGAGSFHDPAEFGRIHFSATPGIRMKKWQMADNILKAEIAVPENFPSRGRFAAVIYGKKHYAPGKTLEIQLQNPEINPKKSAVPIEFRWEAGGKTLFRQHVTALYRQQGSFELSDFYVIPEKLQSVKYRCDLPRPVDLRIMRGKKTVKISRDVPLAGTLDLRGIAPGRVTVEARSRADGTFAGRLLIVKDRGLAAPPLPPGGIKVDKNRFRAGNKPVFLIGGSNTVVRGLQHSEAFSLDTANYGRVKHGAVLRRLPYVRLIRKPSVGFIMHDNWRETAEKAVADAPADQLHRLCYEAHLDIYIADGEKLVRHDSVPFFREKYRLLKQKFPERIFTIHSDRNNRIADYAGCCDVLEGAFWSSSYADNQLANLDSDMKRLRQLAGNKPALFWLGASIPTPYVRCAEELRSGVYCAVFNDMAGVVFHLGHSGVPLEMSRMWSLISGINAEISSWYQTYADGEKLDDFILSGGEEFVVRAWKYRGRHYVGVVNTAYVAQKLHLRCATGVIKDDFPACDAKIYQLL